MASLWIQDEEFSRLNLDDLGATAPVSPDEEQRLIKVILNGKKALKKLQRRPEIDGEQRRQLSAQVEAGAAARKQLIKANGRLVIHIATKYYGNWRSLNLAEKCQEGVLGLIRAIDKFDKQKGVRLSTYATWWIRQSIGRALITQTCTVRLPVHRFDQLQKVYRTKLALTQQFGREPTLEQLAAAMEEPVDKIEQTFIDAQDVISLDAPIKEDEETTGYDLTEDPIPALQDVDHTLLREAIYRALGGLTPREFRILELRYGLRDGQPLTLQEVATRFGLTRERIRQLEQGALAKLRDPATASQLIDYLS